MVIACWCQREATADKPLGAEQQERLRFLYEEWAHPYFISIQEFCRLMEVRVCARVLRMCVAVAAESSS